MLEPFHDHRKDSDRLPRAGNAATVYTFSYEIENLHNKPEGEWYGVEDKQPHDDGGCGL